MNWIKDLLTPGATRGVLTSLGMMGPTLNALAVLLNTFVFGEVVITEGQVAELLQHAETAVNAIFGAGMLLTGWIGRYNAETNLRSGRALERARA